MPLRRSRSTFEDKRLEEYDFYPFEVTDDGHVTFSAERFTRAVEHLLEVQNRRAAGELIVIGEQNLVRDTLPSDDLRSYKEFYRRYDGEAVIVDNEAFLANYRRIVDHIGRSFPNTGIEILLHNLVNPSRSLTTIHNAAVTGRSVGMGATNLVLDLKTRRAQGQDKVNYELNIGARRFKCTTVPIFRPDYGLVGAICINIDVHFLREVVMTSEAHLTAFFDNLLRTDFELDENILPPDEFRSALRGKRHYMDEAIHTSGTRTPERRLAAILFSDIVLYSAMMEEDEAATLRVVTTNDGIHDRAAAVHRGRVIKRMGDGVMAAFDTASDAVAAAASIQDEVKADGRYRVRIGIHLGEVTDDGDDIYGDGVNIAARVEGIMGPGEVGITQVVYDNLRNRDGFAAEPLGEHALKNVSNPVNLYAVKAPPEG
jgi:class 3 adenylate cyclase